MTDSLRNAILARDEEDDDSAYRALCDDASCRLDTAALGCVVGETLVERLREPVSVCFGEPCKPFSPPIHLEASVAIEKLEDGEPCNEAVIANLVCRLVGFYGLGPNGTPEFGYRLYPTTPLKLEAAGRICALSPQVGTSLGITATESSPHRGPIPM